MNCNSIVMALALGSLMEAHSYMQEGGTFDCQLYITPPGGVSKSSYLFMGEGTIDRKKVRELVVALLADLEALGSMDGKNTVWKIEIKGLTPDNVEEKKNDNSGEEVADGETTP